MTREQIATKEYFERCEAPMRQFVDGLTSALSTYQTDKNIGLLFRTVRDTTKVYDEVMAVYSGAYERSRRDWQEGACYVAH